jgi:serpin B
VDVNEEGTEAAAVTVIETAIESVPSLPEFVADHPFIFIIQDDESGTIIFMGKVTDPTV